MYKKIFLSGFVLLTFVIYSITQRNDGSSVTVGSTVKPATSSSTSSSLATTTNAPSSSTTPSASSISYKNGSFTGKAADAYYGYVQVQAVITDGKISNVKFLEYPKDQRNSVEINSQAMPLLTQQAIKTQSAQVDGVSGASDTSQAFIQSLTDALVQAKV